VLRHQPRVTGEDEDEDPGSGEAGGAEVHGDPQRAAGQHDRAHAVAVHEPAADHEQALLAEGPQAEDEADHPARHADRGAEVFGEERQYGVEADDEGELGEDQQAQEWRQVLPGPLARGLRGPDRRGSRPSSTPVTRAAAGRTEGPPGRPDVRFSAGFLFLRTAVRPS
jgi:hypothetical protein